MPDKKIKKTAVKYETALRGWIYRQLEKSENDRNDI